MPDLPVAELATLSLAIVAGGALTGLLAGLFGVGGGVVVGVGQSCGGSHNVTDRL